MIHQRTSLSYLDESFFSKSIENIVYPWTRNATHLMDPANIRVTESYKDFEHLEKETEIISRSYNTSNNNESDYTRGNASLEVNINSNVIGKAHVAWQSKELMPDFNGRHEKYGYFTEDLTGVFDIEKFIQLWSNSTLDSVKLNWLPCS